MPHRDAVGSAGPFLNEPLDGVIFFFKKKKKKKKKKGPHAPANGRTGGGSPLRFGRRVRQHQGNAESPTPTPKMIPRPLVERELAGLLVNPDR